MELEKNKVMVQIGTNNGNDDFNKIVKDSSPSIVILIEPNSSLIRQIKNCYVDINNVFIENVAITDVDTDVVKLVIPKNNINGRSVNGLVYGDGLYSLLPMDDWGDDFDTIEAPGMSFDSLCKKYDITDIHYLQIDTEGYDSEIIKSIDFDTINIDIIQYEEWGFGEDCYKRYGEKSKLYGINGMKYVSNLLESKGYELNSTKTSDGTMNIIATKK